MRGTGQALITVRSFGSGQIQSSDTGIFSKRCSANDVVGGGRMIVQARTSGITCRQWSFW